MSRRIACLGTKERPCPAHAWWYSAGRGRPRERCGVCWPVHEAERRRENSRNDGWKRRVLAAAAALDPEHAKGAA
jgi:hypothetical protein